MNSDDRLAKPLSEFKVLIVDDEKALCSFLHEALKEDYNVTTCCCGADAFSLMQQERFDLLVADLMLPDTTGIELLKFAKEQDAYTEVIIITGYASLDSAAWAINLGAASYLIKPLSLDEFTGQVSRAIANRSFHLKSLMLMRQSEGMTPQVKEHLNDITTLYNFSRKLMLSLEIPEIIQIILDDINERMDSAFCAVGVNFLDFCELFAMPHAGKGNEADIRRAIAGHWEGSFDFLDKQRFLSAEMPFTLFEGRKGAAEPAAEPAADPRPVSIPMMVKGKTIGALVMFLKTPSPPGADSFQFLYVYTSLIAAIVEHAYIDMQAQLLAKTDSLTGVANYRLFHESLGREISRADRRKTQFSLVLFDIDDFKKVNDTFGHLAGNEVLKHLTKRIASMIRKGDLLARYGGEEFALILPDTSVEGARILAERMRAAIDAHACMAGRDEIHYTVSFGISYYNGDAPADKDSLIAAADGALYVSKSKGKNRVSIS